MKRMAGCWFCLSNPEVEKHLIVSIGEETYLTLAKGGITPQHCLIVPIAHAPASIFLEEAQLNELERYKTAITNCFEKEKKAAIFVEQFLPTKHAVHMHIQIVPIPMEKAAGAQAAFEKLASELDLELAVLEEGDSLKELAYNRYYIRIRTKIDTAFPLAIFCTQKILAKNCRP